MHYFPRTMFLQFFSLGLIVALIKLQIEVLEESKVMIPDCKRRIKTAYLDLQELVVSDSDSSNEHFETYAI